MLAAHDREHEEEDVECDTTGLDLWNRAGAVLYDTQNPQNLIDSVLLQEP